MAQGSSFSLCHPLPRAHGSTGTGRQFFHVDVSILLKTEQTVEGFKKKTKRLHEMMKEITLTKLCVSDCIIN